MGYPRPRTSSVVDRRVGSAGLTGASLLHAIERVADADGFDAFVEEACRSFYAPVLGRASLVPGRYFRLLLVGYFEGIDSERGIAWRAARIRWRSGAFCALASRMRRRITSTISRTRRLIDLETPRVYVGPAAPRGRRSLEGPHGRDRRHHLGSQRRHAKHRATGYGGDYQAYLTRLAAASGIKTPTREVHVRALTASERSRPPTRTGGVPAIRTPPVAKMKDGRTYLAHKAEHAIDLESGALVAVTLQDADEGDTTTIADTATAPPSKSRPRTRPPRPRRACTRPWRTRVPQQRDDGGSGRGGPAVVHLGTEPWPARLVRRARRPSARLWESPSSPGGSRAMLAAAPGRTRRSIVCAPL